MLTPWAIRCSDQLSKIELEVSVLCDALMDEEEYTTIRATVLDLIDDDVPFHTSLKVVCSVS